MKKRAVWSRVLISLILLGLLLSVSCSKKSEQDEKIELSLMMHGDNTPTENNSVLLEIEKRLGIDLSVIYVPENDYAAKLNTLIAARTLPSVFTIDAIKVEANELRDQGLLAKLDKLLEKQGKAILAELGDVLYQVPINQGGKGIYAVIPGSRDYTSNLSVRSDWLAKLGLSMPKNLDELYTVLQAFTFKDPDGNGKNDTVGYVGSMASMRTFEHIFGAYGICVDKPYLLADGTVTTYMKSPLYLDAIKYLRKLYQDGLMDPDFATIPLMSAFEKLWTGRTGVFDFQCVGTTNNWMPGRYTEKPVPTFDFAIIAGPGGKGGPIKQYPRYNYYWSIAGTSKNQEKAMELLNFLYTEEGDELTYRGIEGLHFEWVDKANGKYKLLDKYTDAATYRADGAFVYNKQLPMINAEVRTLNKQTQEGQALARENSVEYPFIIGTLKATSEYGPRLSDITREAFARLIVTKGDLDKEYTEFVKSWESEGGLEYEKEATAAYKAQLAAQKK